MPPQLERVVRARPVVTITLIVLGLSCGRPSRSHAVLDHPPPVPPWPPAVPWTAGIAPVFSFDAAAGDGAHYSSPTNRFTSVSPLPHDAAQPVTPQVPIAGIRRAALYGVYVGGYAAAARVGTRLGLDHDYKVRRLETAYAYDLFAHAYTTQQLGLVFTSYNQLLGLSESESRRLGVWWGAFGMLTFMEVLNGFMPNVRFDPLDIAANFAGAWLADGGRELARQHPHLQRLSLQFGPKSLRRMFSNDNSQGLVENVWHDYPNGRFGIGYDISWGDRRWVTVLATYEITSWDVSVMKNRFGLGIELPVVAWLSPLLDKVPGGRQVTSAYEWLDRRLIFPFFYVQILSVDADPWSNRQPFEE